nr:alpha-1,2-fucosyltransferase [Helicobacter didelphidarum]
MLLQDFTLKIPLDSKNLATKNRIVNTKDSVSLHIRRGDYLESVNYFIHLGSGYYNGALRALKKRVSKAHIFVFSNDIEWCKNHLLSSLDSHLIQDFTFEFVDNNGEGQAAFEMELMKTCQHNIIANSTFSWWAAYLNQNPQKIVICPNKMVYSKNEHKNYKKEWIKIDYIWGNELNE